VNIAKPPPSAANFELHHLSPCIGTEVHGIDLRCPHDDATFDWLAGLLVERKVLFFRDQDISVEEHIQFARGFGDIEVHPFTDNDAEHPEVIQLANGEANPPRINVWHSDVTWREAPSLGSILRARVIPSVGGDTLFANMEAAYDSLDDAMKERLEPLNAIHDNEVFLRGMERRGATDDQIAAKRAEFPPVRHPVVRTHPISGRKSLYVNRVFTRTIDGMDEAEAKELLSQLYLTAWVPDVQCRFRWREDSLAFWDNRASQHYAAADYWPAERIMERVTVIGDRPR
jgi:taurine dioxygenase